MNCPHAIESGVHIKGSVEGESREIESFTERSNVVQTGLVSGFFLSLGQLLATRRWDATVK